MLHVILCSKTNVTECQHVCFIPNRALALLLERDCSRLEELRHGHSTGLHVAATNDHVECVRLLVINVSVPYYVNEEHPREKILH